MSYNLSYMAVVSVRVEDEVLAVLKEHKINVSEVAREALGDKARRLKALDGLERLQSWSAPAGDESVVDIIRKLRDER